MRDEPTRFAGGQKYEKRIYLDSETDQRLRTIAQKLGYVVERGPTAGEGSPQALLIALCAHGVDEAMEILASLKKQP